jgi:excisionase family DNA binding protein
MNYTVGTAAKATGKSKPTISRAIKNGLISAARTPDGSGYLIDAAELHRVFPPLSSASNETPPVLHHETPNETGELQVEIRMLRERLEDKDKVIEDLRHRLDAEAEDRRRLTMLLTAERPSPAPVAAVEPPKRAWWQLFSR